MKKEILLYTVTGLLIFVTKNELFAQFTITGELRPRTELRSGFKTLKEKDTDPAFFTEQRSRLYLDFTKDKLTMNVSLQDVRIWGSTNQIYKSDPTLFNLYEAWGRYAIDDKYAFKAGRQIMHYDNARFLGSLDWAQQGRSHDALLFSREDSDKIGQLHLVFAFNQRIPFEPVKLTGTDYLGVNNYKTMLFAWWHKDFKNGEMSALFHNDGRQTADTSMAYRQTYALLGNYKLGEFKFAGELYFQGGMNPRKIDVSALFFGINGTYNTNITPLTLGFEFVSGTSLTDVTDKSFSPIYGTNHKYYGFMDYFYVGNYHGQAGQGKTSGLIDVYLKTKFNIGKKSNLVAHLHYFASPVKIYLTSDTSGDTFDSTLGLEVDLRYNVVLTKDVNFYFGYSQMFATETMEAVKGISNPSTLQYWAYMMVVFKPVLFDSEKLMAKKSD